jgi:hypothetical protein
MTPQQHVVKLMTNTFQQHLHYTTTRSFLCGMGLAYAIANENYAHIPIIFLTPSIYAGYHAYKNLNTFKVIVRPAELDN